MMKKLLTVSIAAYNVEKYIRKAIESCLFEEIDSMLEILVIDDGSKDGTADIVKEYEKKYPNVVKLIHKENGGYGTTVNNSVKLAQGRFFKLLDGDDWFDTEGLKKLLDILKNTSSDIIFNQMYKEYPDKELLEQDLWEKYSGKEIMLSEVEAGIFAGMWEMTVRTEILRKDWLDLPGKLLYTDHFYIMQSLPYAEKVLFMNFPVYCYRLGYSEQSVSLSSRRKHIDDIVNVSNIVSKYYVDYCKESPNFVYARERARFTYMEARRAIMLKKYSIRTMKEIKNFDQNLKKIDVELYKECEKRGGKKSLIFMRRTAYWGYFLLVPKDILYRKIKERVNK